jgi:uncharacterized NAD(P)/FAD-binding protein YdhS
MKNKNSSTIAIIGAGATGVAAFIAMVRYQAASKITLIDPYPASRGLAYANTDPELLCNTSVDLMSLLPLESDDLLHYLHNRGHSHITAKDLIPRQQVGIYIRDRFADHLKIAQSYGIEVTQIYDHAIRILRSGDNSYLIHTKNGHTVSASEVVVCNGYNSPIVPEVISSYVSHPSICISPYPERNLEQKLSPYHRVLILGSKLSAVDASLILCRNQHKVTMTSPSGKLPAVRTCLIRSSNDVTSFARVAAMDIDYHEPGYEQKLRKLVKSTIEMISLLPLEDQIAIDHDVISLLRKETELAKSGKTPWQYALIALVDVLNFIIKPQDRDLVREVKRNYRELLSRYLGAVPLQNAQKLLGYIEDKRLQVTAGRIASVERNGNEWLVRWQSGEQQAFDAIVCASGQHPPKFHATNDAVTFINDPSQPVLCPELTSDLAVRLPGAAKSERIWFVGIPAHISVPAVYALYIGVAQGNKVAKEIAESIKPCETDPLTSIKYALQHEKEQVNCCDY